jgi:hypothetical protein
MARSIRYRNHFRWRIMPPEGASELGFFDRSFENKKQAVEYQKRVKATFPHAPVCIIDMGRWMVETAVEKCGGVMCVTGRSKTAASSITMKDVRRYGKLV